MIERPYHEVIYQCPELLPTNGNARCMAFVTEIEEHYVPCTDLRGAALIVRTTCSDGHVLKGPAEDILCFELPYKPAAEVPLGS